MSIDKEEKNYYELLGVEKEASVEEIKAAFKDIARVFHPDSNFYSEILEVKPTATEMSFFKSVSAAYNTLVDVEKRDDYDKSMLTQALGQDDWPYSSRPFDTGGPEQRASGQFYASTNADASRSFDARFSTANQASGWNKDPHQNTFTNSGSASNMHKNSSVMEMLHARRRAKRKVLILSVSIVAILATALLVSIVTML